MWRLLREAHAVKATNHYVVEIYLTNGGTRTKCSVQMLPDDVVSSGDKVLVNEYAWATACGAVGIASSDLFFWEEPDVLVIPKYHSLVLKSGGLVMCRYPGGGTKVFDTFNTQKVLAQAMSANVVAAEQHLNNVFSPILRQMDDEWYWKTQTPEVRASKQLERDTLKEAFRLQHESLLAAYDAVDRLVEKFDRQVPVTVVRQQCADTAAMKVCQIEVFDELSFKMLQGMPWPEDKRAHPDLTQSVVWKFAPELKIVQSTDTTFEISEKNDASYGVIVPVREVELSKEFGWRFPVLLIATYERFFRERDFRRMVVRKSISRKTKWKFDV